MRAAAGPLPARHLCCDEMAPPRLSVYRRGEPDEGARGPGAQRPLSEACDALHVALLTLESQDAEDNPERTAAQARAFLAEAVNALNRARVFVPEVFSYTPSVIAASEPEPAVELARLHQMATRLLWYNHRLLPTRTPQPLRPEDEAQLATLVRALSRTARAARALRHAWLAAAAALAVLLPLGPTAVVFGLVACFALVWLMQAVSVLRGAPALPERL